MNFPHEIIIGVLLLYIFNEILSIYPVNNGERPFWNHTVRIIDFSLIFTNIFDKI